MDLKEAWKNLEQQKLSKPINGTVEVPKHSKHPVSQLIRKFTLGLGFCVLFEVIFIALVIVAEQPIVKLGLGIVSFLYACLFALNFSVLQNLKRLYQSDEPILVVLKAVHSIVTQTIKFQQKFSWAFFPICVAGGFLLGLSIKKDALEMIVQPRVYLILAATMVIVTPACYFLSKWMTNLTYGKYLKQIEGLLTQTKED